MLAELGSARSQLVISSCQCNLLYVHSVTMLSHKKIFAVITQKDIGDNPGHKPVDIMHYHGLSQHIQLITPGFINST